VFIIDLESLMGNYFAPIAWLMVNHILEKVGE